MLSNLNEKIISNYNFGIVANDFAKIRIGELMQNKFEIFINAKKIDKNFTKELQFNNIFSDIDFLKKMPDENSESFINKFLYPFVFNDLVHNKVLQNYSNLQLPLKFAFTIDEDLTPSILKSQKGEQINYGELILGKIPVVIFIRISAQEIFSYLKKSI